MAVFATKASAIADNLVSVHGADPATVKTGPFIDIIMQVLTALLPMLAGCLTPKATAAELNARLKSLTIWDHMYIRRQIRRDVDSPHVFREVGAQLQIEIVKAATATTVEETQAAMDEAAAS